MFTPIKGKLTGNEQGLVSISVIFKQKNIGIICLKILHVRKYMAVNVSNRFPVFNPYGFRTQTIMYP